MGALIPSKAVLMGAVWSIVLLAALNRVKQVRDLIAG